MDINKVMLMNEYTWNKIRNNMLDSASCEDDPIAFLNKFNGIDLEFDNELPDDVVEVYEKWMLEEVRKYGRLLDNE